MLLTQLQERSEGIGFAMKLINLIFKICARQSHNQINEEMPLSVCFKQFIKCNEIEINLSAGQIVLILDNIWV